MAQDVINILWVGLDFLRDCGRGRSRGGELRQHTGLQLQNPGRGFFPGFNSRLMIRIDVHE